jgi:hypothetical protein
MNGNGWRWPASARAGLVLVLLCVAVLGFTACDDSDVVPPAGSEVTLSANPATLFITGTSIPQTTLRARVVNSVGISLPGQTVVFDTTEGVLVPDALTPMETDGDGIATAFLGTVRTATVTAISGTATSQLTITVLQSDLQDVILNGDNTISNCNLALSYTAQAIDVNGVPVPGVTLIFELRDQTGAAGTTPGVAGSFSVNQGVTDANGELDTLWFPDINDCTQKCVDPNSCDNSTSVVATDQTGLFSSVPIVILDGV